MLSPNTVLADYRKTAIPWYNDNPFIEALPPILEPKFVIKALRSNVKLVHSDKNASPTTRSHLLAELMSNFFQPIIRHVQLESKLSIMLREGYVGRNLKSGNLAEFIKLVVTISRFKRLLIYPVSALLLGSMSSAQLVSSF